MKMHSNNKKITNELILVSLITKYLQKLNYRVFIEVPNMGQSTDIVARKNRWLTFVEAKRHDWRKGLEQCKAHEAVADFICLAISSVKVSKDLSEAVQAKGYGLIHCEPYSGKCHFVYKPKINKNIWTPQRNVLLKNMRSIDNEH